MDVLGTPSFTPLSQWYDPTSQGTGRGSTTTTGSHRLRPLMFPTETLSTSAQYSLINYKGKSLEYVTKHPVFGPTLNSYSSLRRPPGLHSYVTLVSQNNTIYLGYTSFPSSRDLF